MSDPKPYRAPPRQSALTALAIVLALVLGGCASDGKATNPFKGMKNPFAGGVGNPFGGPTEAGFLALVRHNCAAFSIGGEPVNRLLDSNKAFADLTSKLYRGDVSNDEYLNQVLQLFPAVDANIPATGCVVDQLQACLAGRCSVRAEAKPVKNPIPADADQFQTPIDETPIPSQEKAGVDAMIEEAERERAEDPQPLP